MAQLYTCAWPGAALPSEMVNPAKGAGRPRTAVRTRHEGSPSFASSATVRSRMQAQRSRDTAPEFAVRRLLHAAGLRYRVDRPPVPGLRRRADLVFGPPRVAVYVDGCFWHGCPEHGTRPRANSEWWEAKISRNRARDADTDTRLAAAGWRVIRVWEHEPPAEAAERVAAAVQAGREDLRRPRRRRTTPRGGTAT